MWKHKNFINLQLCAPPPTRIIDISLNGSTVSINVCTFVTWKENYLELKDWNILSYTCTATNVVWNDGTILQYNGVDVLPTDNIISNGQYTTRAAAPTLTFKHFYDAGTIGSGTVKFRHYSQQEPSSGETWVLNDTFTSTLADTTINFTVKDNTTNYTGLRCEVALGEYRVRYYHDGTYTNVYEGGTWYIPTNKIINFSTSPTGDLLTWLQANGTKQGGGGAVTHKVSEIAGYWTLNETITAPTTDVNETFNWFYCTNAPDGSFAPSAFIVTATDVKIQGFFGPNTSAHTLYENNSWRDMTYRYIAIPNSETEISDTFYNWFIANATKRSETFAVTIVNNVDAVFKVGFLKTGAATSPIIKNIPANTTVEMNIQLSTDIIQAGAYMYFTFAGSYWANENIAATGDVVIISGLSSYVNAVLASTGTITLSGYND